MSELSELRDALDHKLGRCRLAEEKVHSTQGELTKARQAKEHLENARSIAQQVAEQVQSEAHRRIADVVNRSLEVVFDEPYEFKINFEQKRGRTEACLVFCREGMEIDPLSASGGGVIDVAAFALRVSCLMLKGPRARKTLVLDEPFKNVSKEYLPRVRSLVESLSHDLNVQIIMVTHLGELAIGKAHRIG